MDIVDLQELGPGKEVLLSGDECRELRNAGDRLKIDWLDHERAVISPNRLLTKYPGFGIRDAGGVSR